MAVRWRNSFSALAAAMIGQAEIATRIAKRNASMANSRIASVAKYLRVTARTDPRLLDLLSGVGLIGVSSNVIRFIPEHSINGELHRVRLRIVKIA
jgi:hypothetical protein